MTATPYADAALDYSEAGWPGVLPLPPRRKADPPVGWTGYDGKDASTADVLTWAQERPDANLALRLPDGVVGIDVDTYDGKGGAATLAAAVARWGALPATWSSTSRDDGSRIRFYRVPPGSHFPGVLGPGVEIIQRHHRYAVVEPSIHPEGRTYRWRQPSDIPHVSLLVPRPLDLAALPSAWVEGLVASTTSGGSTWTDPQLGALVRTGIPAGVNQDDVLRDVAFTLAAAHTPDQAAHLIWLAITDRTTLSRPGEPWTDADFRRHWDGAVAKINANEPTVVEPQDDLFVDVGGLLDAGLPEPPPPHRLHRVDEAALFYDGKVNVLFGDPESGKTWIAYAAAVETLNAGDTVAIADLDHNGDVEILTRLLALGALPDALRDPMRFRLSEPDDRLHIDGFITAMRTLKPKLVIVDSIGELVALYGLSSNSPDDWTVVNRAVLTALADTGACVIGVDHLPKDSEARSHGQTGTLAKKRTANGVTLKVTVTEMFTPGYGGAASLTIYKDRPGGLRRRSPRGERHAPAGRFVMTADLDGGLAWNVTEPTLGDEEQEQRLPRYRVRDEDVAELDALDPAPRSQRDVVTRCGWGKDRALAVLQVWRALQVDGGDA